jgi:two-component system, sporulation sensor kinase E
MRSNPLAAINAVAVAIGRFSSLQSMLEYALDQVLDVVQTEAGCVYLLDEDREELDLVVHRGLPEALMRDIDRIKLGEGLSGRVALTGEPIVIRNLKDDPRLIHKAARDEGLRGFASVPLRSSFKTYGTLNIHTHADRAFSEEDVQLLTSMASQIGLAVANTRLYMNLQASERKFRGLVENAEDLVYLTDRAGRILYANQALERLLGLDPAAVCAMNRTILSLLHPADHDRVASRLPVMLSGHVAHGLQFRMIHADGEQVRWFSQTNVPLRDETGRVTGMQCIAHDMTEQREMQEQIAGAERLADLGRMAATIAHEIRNPLGAIVNSINALRHPRIAGDHRLLDIISEEAARLDGIIKDFLMFARPPLCVPLVCDLPALIETTLFLFKRGGRAANGVELRCRYDPGLPQAFADSHQLRQVLWNLISNAVDAIADRGAVDVDAHTAPDGRFVWISVTDDGPGIRDPKQIFEPFFTTKAQGTGLGLAVVGRIIRDHGGTIRVERADRRGARIAFSVPVATVQSRPSVETA